MKDIRWGIIGAGHIAQRFATDIKHSQTGTLIAVASRNIEKAKQFAASFDNIEAFSAYEELAAQEDIDAIYIATPNAMHKSHCMLAIAAGKSVLCEKPLSVTGADAREIADAAKAANVFCMEAMWTRFLPTICDLKARIDSGVMGPVKHLDITLGFPRKEAQGDAITDPDLGGGALLDLGVYGVSIAQALLGPAKLSSSDVALGDKAVRTATLLLRHDAGAMTTISVSHATKLKNTLTVSAQNESATINAPFIEARNGKIEALSWTIPGKTASGLKKRIASSPLYTYARGLKNVVGTFKGPKFGSNFPGGGFQFEIDEVGRCIQNGKTESDALSLQSSINVLDILDSVIKSNK